MTTKRSKCESNVLITVFAVKLISSYDDDDD